MSASAAALLRVRIVTLLAELMTTFAVLPAAAFGVPNAPKLAEENAVDKVTSIAPVPVRLMLVTPKLATSVAVPLFVM